MIKQKKRSRLCANYNASDGVVFSPFAPRTAGTNCKDCVYFSSKNCGADLSKAAYHDNMVI